MQAKLEPFEKRLKGVKGIAVMDFVGVRHYGDYEESKRRVQRERDEERGEDFGDIGFRGEEEVEGKGHK